MEDGKQATTTDTDGKEDNKTVETPQEDKSLLQRSMDTAERLEAANKVMTENLDRQEKLAAESLLGGTTEGRVEPKKEEQTPQDYAKAAIEGKLNGAE